MFVYVLYSYECARTIRILYYALPNVCSFHSVAGDRFDSVQCTLYILVKERQIRSLGSRCWRASMPVPHGTDVLVRCRMRICLLACVAIFELVLDRLNVYQSSQPIIFILIPASRGSFKEIFEIHSD